MKFVPKELRSTGDISRGDSNWRSVLKNILYVAIFLVGLYVLLGLVAGIMAGYIPETFEAKLFSWESGLEGEKSPEFGQAGEVFSNLIKQPSLRPLPYQLFMVSIQEPNAVAMPGGGVGVSQALLEAVSGETGLAMVLGHELGHHQKRHCLERLGRALIYQSVMALLFGHNRFSVVDIALLAGESGYSRRQEREADEFGLNLVHQAFGKTEGALEFFEMIDREYGSKTSRWTVFMSSHPYTPDRTAYLRELQESLSPGRNNPDED
jgi:Zn-dependent protease with chaperone function